MPLEPWSEQKQAFSRISKVVDSILKENDVFREEIDKRKFMEICSGLMENGQSPEDWNSISEEELVKMVKQLMAADLLGRLLDDLTPEQVEIFNDAVEGR